MISNHFNVRTVRVAAFLAFRYIMRMSKWQTILVTFVMTLTFLNLVAINGVLLGLMDGALLSYNRNYSGDVLISKFPEKEVIERSASVRSVLERVDGVAFFSPRVVESATLEANFQRSIAQPNLVPDRIGISVAGIEVADELAVTDLQSYMVEGSFLTERDTNGVVLGANMIDRYFPAEIGLQTVADVYPGDKVRLTVGESTREFTVRGIVKTKADATDMRVFMLANELKNMLGTHDASIDEFAVRVAEDADTLRVQSDILAYGVGAQALVRTTQEAIGEFLDEIRDTFKVIGNIIGSISVIVASITIFIIIFITAITKRKYIGILKAIGVSGTTIELSYVMLSIFYSLIGVSMGIAILYGFLLPYFNANPIDFPFSDGILSVTPADTITRSAALIVTTIVAGYIPARLIVGRNTLDAILGR